MAQNFGALTDMWMLDPTMFDPTQKSNQFSNFNDAPFPFPPTYNTGPAGGVMNAATGQPIQSYTDWNNQAQADYQKQLAAYNAQPAGGTPGTPGTTLNSAPGQPQVQTSGSWPGQAQGAAAPGSLMATPAMQQMQAGIAAAQAAKTPQQLYTDQQNTAMRNQMLQQQANMSTVQAGQGGFGNMPGGAFNPGSYMPLQSLMPQAGAAAAPTAGGRGPPPTPPNNWMAAINALANPGNPVTQGAKVPMAQGFQPAGGVNQAFLGQMGGGGNRNFLSALAAIQGRPQG
jgi:hypothetical protein